MTEEPKEPKAETVEEQEEQTGTVEALSPEEAEKLRKALKEANKEAAARRKRIDELEAKEKERTEAEMTELERLKKQNAELLETQKQHAYEQAQRNAAKEAGLDVDLADRIRGETPEAMMEDAKRLAELMPKKPQKPRLDSTNPGDTQKGATDEERRKFLGLN